MKEVKNSFVEFTDTHTVNAIHVVDKSFRNSKK